MSHTYVAEHLGFTSLKVLRAAFESLGWTTKEQSKCRTWSHNPDREKSYQVVAVNPNAEGYDIGMVVTPTEVKMEADLFECGGIVEALGKDYKVLKQAYSVQHILEMTKRRLVKNIGHHKLESGTVEIIIES